MTLQENVSIFKIKKKQTVPKLYTQLSEFIIYHIIYIIIMYKLCYNLLTEMIIINTIFIRFINIINSINYLYNFIILWFFSRQYSLNQMLTINVYNNIL